MFIAVLPHSSTFAAFVYEHANRMSEEQAGLFIPYLGDIFLSPSTGVL